MAFDEPELPRATLRGDKLYIEGEQEPYFRDPEHTIWLRVDALSIHRGYVLRDEQKPGGKELYESLHGVAGLERRDRIAVAGLATDPKTPIKFELRPVPDEETGFHWRASIRFQPHDWEFSLGECFWIAGHCTRQYFDDVLAAVRRGYVDHIRVGMETTMWTKDKSSMVEVPRTWHVAPPPDRESRRPALERGKISSLTWEEKFADRTAKEEQGASTVKSPLLVELPSRLYSMLGTLIMIGAALLLLIFLRH